jgi:hypothetical protein
MEARKECPANKQTGPEKIVREIKRKTRRRFSLEEKIRRLSLRNRLLKKTLGRDGRRIGRAMTPPKMGASAIG